MAFPKSVVVICVVVVMSSVGLIVGSSAAQLPQRNRVILAGSVYCYNSSLASAGTYSPIKEPDVDVECALDQTPSNAAELGIEGFVKLALDARSFVNEGLFAFTSSVDLDIQAQTALPEVCHLNVKLAANSCNYDPPLTAIRYSIIPVRSNTGRLLAYVPGPPIAVKA